MTELINTVDFENFLPKILSTQEIDRNCLKRQRVTKLEFLFKVIFNVKSFNFFTKWQKD